VSPLIARYFVPAAVFQGVIVGGGYGTGREVVEFVSRHGPGGGVIACAVIAAGFAAVLAVSFMLAVSYRVRDYRHFLKLLLGPAWVFYEALFIALLVIVLAVVGSAAGEALADGFGLPYAPAVGVILGAVLVCNYFGRRLVERALGTWTLLLMAGLAAFVVAVLSSPAHTVVVAAAPALPVLDAARSGLQFAVYNSALIPVLVYCVAHLERRRDALLAGIVAGFGGALPALLLHLCFMSHTPAVLAEPIPTWWLLEAIGAQAFLPLYFVLLAGTIVLTAVGVLQGVNERLDGWREDRGAAPLSRRTHALVAASLVLVSLLLARVGIIDLVARGYGLLAWGFLAVFTVPLLTRGILLVHRQGVSHAP